MRGIRNRVGRTGACRISGHDCARRVVHVAGSETAAAACSRCGINLRVGLLLNELPFIALYYLLVSTLLAFGQGDIDSPGAWSVVGLAVVTAAGLAVVIRREARADPAAAHAFRAGLGTSLPHRRLPWARILFAPLFMRRPFLVAYGDHDTVVCMEGARSFVAGLRSASTQPRGLPGAHRRTARLRPVPFHPLREGGRRGRGLGRVGHPCTRRSSAQIMTPT